MVKTSSLWIWLTSYRLQPPEEHRQQTNLSAGRLLFAEKASMVDVTLKALLRLILIFFSLHTPQILYELSLLCLPLHPLLFLRRIPNSNNNKTKNNTPSSIRTPFWLYLHPVSIHFMEEDTEWVRLGGDVSVQQAGRSDRQLHPSDAVLRSDTARLPVGGWA